MATVNGSQRISPLSNPLRSSEIRVRNSSTRETATACLNRRRSLVNGMLRRHCVSRQRLLSGTNLDNQVRVDVPYVRLKGLAGNRSDYSDRRFAQSLQPSWTHYLICRWRASRQCHPFSRDSHVLGLAACSLASASRRACCRYRSAISRSKAGCDSSSRFVPRCAAPQR